jgi:hypothetical protein
MNQVRLVSRFRSLLLAAFALLCLGFTSNVLAQNADLTISKNSTSPIVFADSDVTFEIGVGNFSDQTSTPTNTLTDDVPANMTFVSATIPDGWTCPTLPAVGGTGTITCTYESPIGFEQSFLFTFVFHVNSGVPNGTMITNTATIVHGGAGPKSANATVTVGTPPPPPLAPKDVLISEFRLSGPGGNSDEYVEFYCNRDVDCDLSGSNIRGYDPVTQGAFSMTFPSGTIIPARHYLLIADFDQYSLFTYAVPDFDVPNSALDGDGNPVAIPDFFADNEGIQLRGAGEPISIDSVGFAGGGNEGDFIEGTGLQRATSRPSDQYAYVRKRTLGTNGLPQDTDNNANDFVLVSVTGTAHPGITASPVLGAPGPQALDSHRSYDKFQVPITLVEPAADTHASPNHVRVGGVNSGTLSVRRTFTNNTNDFFIDLRFRVIEITTLNSPNTVGEQQGELRLVSSDDAETFTNSENREVVIRGTTLEYDVGCGCQPDQPNGGGLNTTVFVDLSEVEGLDPGEPIDVQFLLNVVQSGAYRFFIYTEAIPFQFQDAPVVRASNGLLTSTSDRKTPRQFINLKRGRKVPGGGKKPRLGAPLPTKSGSVTLAAPTVIPVRVWIAPPNRETTKRKKKTRLRRKASTALRVKAEEKRAGETPSPQN